MTQRHASASLFAELLLAGPLTESSVEARLSDLLGATVQNESLQRLVSAVLSQFATEVPRATHREVTRFIEEHRWFQRVPQRVWPGRVSRLELPRPVMHMPVNEVKGAHVTPIVTPGELAGWLNVTPGRLDSISGRFGRGRRSSQAAQRHYRYRWRRKSSGQWRLLEIPKPRLMQALRKIQAEIMAHLPIHHAAHAFCGGRSIHTAVLPHCGRRVVIHLDLRNFFAAIPRSRVMSVFSLLGYPEPVAHLLSGVCVNRVPGDVLDERLTGDDSWMSRKRLANDHLPQGAPTSPGLSNLCSFRLDRRLHGLARTFEATYTRYADDLIFSGDRPLHRSPSRFLTWVNAILIDEGFTLHWRKTRVMPNSQRQHVCGLSLNERPNISRRQFDQLKATLRNCATRGPQHENRASILHFREHLQGRVAWVTQVNPKKGARLQAIYNTIDWSV